MSENEIARRLEEFTAEEKEIYSRPVTCNAFLVDVTSSNAIEIRGAAC